jgi:hypothetical protein
MIDPLQPHGLKSNSMITNTVNHCSQYYRTRMVLKISMWQTQVTFKRGGSSFIGQDFHKMRKEEFGVKSNPNLTVRNP